jgi:hypothetical protein
VVFQLLKGRTEAEDGGKTQNMKQLKTMLAVAIVAIAMALPSIAAAQYQESRLDNFLSQHPNLKSELSRNPNLIFDKQYRRDHPELQRFMQDHPNIYGKLDRNGRWGAYGPDHQWHEADWWHEHDPAWMYQHHPEWANDHADWAAADRAHHPEWFAHDAHVAHVEHEDAVHHEEAMHHETVQNTEHQQAVENAQHNHHEHH